MASLRLFRGEPGLLRFEGDGVCVTLDLVRSADGASFPGGLDAPDADVGALPTSIKDSRLPAAVVARRCYPEHATRSSKRRGALDPTRLFRSELSRRGSAVTLSGRRRLGRARPSLAEALASAGHGLVLVASDPRDLEAGAADLRIRHGAESATVAAGRRSSRAANAETRWPGSVPRRGIGGRMRAAPARVDDEPDGRPPPTSEVGERLLRINFLSLGGAAWLGCSRSSDAGRRVTVVGFGSVAAARGRGAQHVVRRRQARARELVREPAPRLCGHPGEGPVLRAGLPRHELAFGQRTLLPRADVGRLSSRVLSDLGRDFGVRYHPV